MPARVRLSIASRFSPRQGRLRFVLFYSMREMVTMTSARTLKAQTRVAGSAAACAVHPVCIPTTAHHSHEPTDHVSIAQGALPIPVAVTDTARAPTSQHTRQSAIPAHCEHSLFSTIIPLVLSFFLADTRSYQLHNSPNSSSHSSPMEHDSHHDAHIHGLRLILDSILAPV